MTNKVLPSSASIPCCLIVVTSVQETNPQSHYVMATNPGRRHRKTSRRWARASLPLVSLFLAVANTSFPSSDAFSTTRRATLSSTHSSTLLAEASDQTCGADFSLENVQRIFCISDLHTDNVENIAWLEDKCRKNPSETGPGREDVLIVAGDISHDMHTFRKTLRILQSLECHLFFVPGNHEAWLTRRRNRSQRTASRTSLDKLDMVSQACHDMGVFTQIQLIAPDSPYPIWLVPLHCWYDGSLSIEGCEDLCADFGRWPWTDFLRCRWPSLYPPRSREGANARIPVGLQEHFLSSNEPSLKLIRDSNTAVMTFSHFLPNKQCLPDWKDVSSPVFLRDEWLDHGASHVSAKFAKVAGSETLDSQIRSLMACPEQRQVLHVFGHSHRPKDFVFEGIRYIHNPLGKPREREMRMISPTVDFQLLWDTRTGHVEGERVVRYWEEKGGGKEALIQRLKKRKLRQEARQ